VRTSHGTGVRGLVRGPCRVQPSRRPCPPTRAPPTQGGTLPLGQLPHRRLTQTVAARLRRQNQQGSNARQNLATVILRPIHPARRWPPSRNTSSTRTNPLRRTPSPTRRTGSPP
jgi:hypothetical protein